jgi:hypothetical protein
MRLVMTEADRSPVVGEDDVLCNRAGLDLAAAAPRLRQQRVERFVRNPADVPSGAAHPGDALLFAHAEDGSTVGQGRTRMSGQAAESHVERSRDVFDLRVWRDDRVSPAAHAPRV